MVPFSFADEEFALVQSRALFWPREHALLVADLHLEKASFYARFGQMLPPYDSRETLERVALALRETGARRVFTLGDNFHDGDGADRLEPHAAGMLAALTRATDWVWITGNHDDGSTLGTAVAELAVSGLLLRHEAVGGRNAARTVRAFPPQAAGLGARTPDRAALRRSQRDQADPARFRCTDRRDGRRRSRNHCRLAASPVRHCGTFGTGQARPLPPVAGCRLSASTMQRFALRSRAWNNLRSPDDSTPTPAQHAAPRQERPAL